MNVRTRIVLDIAIVFLVTAIAGTVTTMVVARDIFFSVGQRYASEMLERRRHDIVSMFRTQLQHGRYLSEHDAIRSWMLTGADEAQACSIMVEAKRMLREADVFAVSHRDLGFYFNGRYLNRIEADNPDDSWYWKTVKSDDYNFNIDYNNVLKTTKLWVNIPVLADGRVIGVIGTGLDFEGVVGNLTARSGEDYDVFLLDEDGTVKIHRNEAYIGKVGASTIVPLPEKRYRAIMAALGQDGSKKEIFFYENESDETVIAILAWVPFARWYIHIALPVSGYINAVVVPFIFMEFISLFCIALGLMVIVQRIVLRPLAVFGNSLERIGSMDYSREIPISSRDEFGALAGTINQMQAGLRTYTGRLQELVTQRTQELESLNGELRRRDDIIRRELAIARRIQEALIPTRESFPACPQIVVGARYRAMADLGGDLYDIIRTGKNGYAILIADVCGHGVPAALITAMAKVSFKTHAVWGRPAHEVLDRVNREMFDLFGGAETYLTAGLLLIDLETAVLQYANAGHPPVLLQRGFAAKPELLDAKGFFIGVFPQTVYASIEIPVADGDRFILYTDGISEMHNATHEMYGQGRIVDFSATNRQLDPQGFVDALFDDVFFFSGGEEQEDDQAVMCVDFHLQKNDDLAGHGSAIDIVHLTPLGRQQPFKAAGVKT